MRCVRGSELGGVGVLSECVNFYCEEMNTNRTCIYSAIYMNVFIMRIDSV